MVGTDCMGIGQLGLTRTNELIPSLPITKKTRLTSLDLSCGSYLLILYTYADNHNQHPILKIRPQTWSEQTWSDGLSRSKVDKVPQASSVNICQ